MQLSEITLNDTALLFELIERNREELRESFPITVTSVHDLDSARRFIEERIHQAEQRQGYYFLIREKETIVGVIGIKTIDWTVPKCELAYFTDSQHVGKGICTEAIALIVQHCFSELGMARIYARVIPENVGSRKVLEKNGFDREGVLRHDFRNGAGELVDVEYYGLLWQPVSR